MKKVKKIVQEDIVDDENITIGIKSVEVVRWEPDCEVSLFSKKEWKSY